MSLYCEVQENCIVNGPTLLPAPFQRMSSEELQSRGWYAVSQSMPDTLHHRTEVLLAPTLEIGEGIVVATYTKRSKTEDELTTDANVEWKTLRVTRNSLLAETDYITTADKWSLLSDVQKEQWAAYRQTLRDIPQTFVSPWDVTWATKPI